MGPTKTLTCVLVGSTLGMMAIRAEAVERKAVPSAMAARPCPARGPASSSCPAQKLAYGSAADCAARRARDAPRPATASASTARAVSTSTPDANRLRAGSHLRADQGWRHKGRWVGPLSFNADAQPARASPGATAHHARFPVYRTPSGSDPGRAVAPIRQRSGARNTRVRRSASKS